MADFCSFCGSGPINIEEEFKDMKPGEYKGIYLCEHCGCFILRLTEDEKKEVSFIECFGYPKDKKLADFEYEDIEPHLEDGRKKSHMEAVYLVANMVTTIYDENNQPITDEEGYWKQDRSKLSKEAVLKEFEKMDKKNNSNYWASVDYLEKFIDYVVDGRKKKWAEEGNPDK